MAMPAEAYEEDMADRGGPMAGTTGSRPWRHFYGSVPASLDYPEVTLYEALAATARRVPDAIAWDFLGTRSDYRTLLAQVAIVVPSRSPARDLRRATAS
jgi:hypothetical protein